MSSLNLSAGQVAIVAMGNETYSEDAPKKVGLEADLKLKERRCIGVHGPRIMLALGE